MAKMKMMLRSVLFSSLVFWGVVGMGVAQTDGQKDSIEEKIGLRDHVLPHPRQLRWQQREYTAFVHFTVNTFTGREWGEGTESPSIFNPSELDVKQWVQVFKDAGMKMVIITAKHHDGFCLWPSRYTEHSVKNSPWKKGQGDLVGELSRACREAGLEFGIYISPWDRHEPSYGNSSEYNAFYMGQLTELLTQYGPLGEVWFDGAPGQDSPLRKKQVYDFVMYRSLVRRLQPDACMFADDGPDCRWVGNESGYAGETCWSMLHRSEFGPGQSDANKLNAGQIDGADWVPAECDVSIRPGWFYHAAEDDKVKTLEQLLDIYFGSVGRNGLMLLNIPPDQRGLIHETDTQRLLAFRGLLDRIFAEDIAAGASVKASTVRKEMAVYQPSHLVDGDPETIWTTDDGVVSAELEMDLPQEKSFNVIMLQEYIKQGQRIKSFDVEAWTDGQWQQIASGTTIGYKRLLRIEPVVTQKLRLRILNATDCPILCRFGLFSAPTVQSNTILD
jgi:alpha-L-fucosidase